MSFDLFFMAKRPIQRAEVIQAFEGLTGEDPFKASGDSERVEVALTNQHTGVYFRFVVREPSPEPLADDGPVGGLYDAGITFHLNFARPSFFALEAMEVVERLVFKRLWQPDEHISLAADQFIDQEASA